MGILRVPPGHGEASLLAALDHVRQHNGFLTAQVAGAEAKSWLSSWATPASPPGQAARTVRSQDGVEFTSLAASNGPEDRRGLEKLGWRSELEEPLKLSLLSSPVLYQRPAQGPYPFVRRDRIAGAEDDLRPLARALFETLSSVYGWSDAGDLSIRVENSDKAFPTQPIQGELPKSELPKSKAQHWSWGWLGGLGSGILIALDRIGILPSSVWIGPVIWLLVGLVLYATITRAVTAFPGLGVGMDKSLYSNETKTLTKRGVIRFSALWAILITAFANRIFDLMWADIQDPGAAARKWSELIERNLFWIWIGVAWLVIGGIVWAVKWWNRALK